MALLRTLNEESFGEREAKHLLWRAGFGGTRAQVRQLVSWGLAESVDRLIDVHGDAGYARPKADDFASTIVAELDANERVQLRNARQNQDEETLARFRMRRQETQRRDRKQVKEMQQWFLTRMIESTRPLEEKMTLFWHGHFATSYRTTENSYHMFLQNQLFRQHAVGNFGALLSGIIHDPAMLRYLNNHQNRKQSPNENLARELMELFSLGPGTYRERDIKEGARALTGYTFDGNAYQFNAQSHDFGQKRILGRAGAFDGDDFVRIILEQPACAAFICTKLYRFFVGDIPKDAAALRKSEAYTVIQRLAQTMRANQYAIAPVLHELFLSEYFFSNAVVAQRIKSPVELVVGAVRTMETPVRDLGVLVDAMDMMGQELFFPPNVAGWPGGRTWINTSTYFARQNVLIYLLGGTGPFARPRDARRVYDAPRFVESFQGNTPSMMQFLLASMPSELQIDTIAAEKNDLAKLTLIAALPEYQLC